MCCLFSYSRSVFFFFFSSRRRHTRWNCDWSSDVCSSDLCGLNYLPPRLFCEDCFTELSEFVPVPGQGKVAAVTVSHVDRTGGPLSQPQVWALVTFRGIRGGLVHRLLVPPDRARTGLAVRPRVKSREARTGAITDIEGFEPVGS